MKFTKTYEEVATRLASLNGNPYALYLLGTLDGARSRAAWQAASQRQKQERSSVVKQAEQAILQSLVSSISETQGNV